MRAAATILALVLALASGGVARADVALELASPSAGDAGGDGFSTFAPTKARVIFAAPEGVQGLSVKFDGHPVPVGTMTTRAFTIDPGVHSVSATGMKDGREVAYEARFQVDAGEFVRLPLPMTEVSAASHQEQGCLSPSRTEEDVKACVAARTPAQSGCGACLIAPAEPPPMMVVFVLPLAAFMRRRTRMPRRR